MAKPTTPELKIMLDNLDRKFDEKVEDMMKVLVRIEAQTTKTNGRVNKLELWRSILTGAWIVFMLGAPLFAKLYVEDVARKTAQEVVASINSNWDVTIQK